MKGEIVGNWIKRADEDLVSAKHLLKVKDPPTGAISFHCQQTVEKYLKAYLTHFDIRVEKTHDLTAIMDLCIMQNKDFENLDKDKVSSLSPYAVDVRYPNEFSNPSVDEAKVSFEIASKVKDFVLKKLNMQSKNRLC